MPLINGKHYPYTKSGMKAASKAKKAHHSGRGTKARINTIAEKHLFKSQISD